MGARMRTILVAIILSALLVTGPVFACDSDSECGVGGTCIKRERRARGVCYGGDLSKSETPAAPTAIAEPEFATPGPGGAPMPGMGLFGPLANPSERPANACIVTQECPAGMDCVITGPGGGTCIAL